jgi:pimeloyl-ACP methyl ester carboxylesterase
MTMQLIFIHGSGGCRESWRYQVEYFKGADAINLPGHPDGDLLPTIAEYAEWLHGYIQEKAYQDVVLVGHSLGGGISLQYALDYPGHVAGIVTVGSGGRLRVRPKFIELLEKAVVDPSPWERRSRSNYGAIDPDLAEVMRRREIENTPAAFLNDMKACDRFDILDRIERISTPLLAIVGEADDMTPPKYSLFMADKLPNARAVVIPGGGHMVFAEKPDLLNHDIEEFLDTL